MSSFRFAGLGNYGSGNVSVMSHITPLLSGRAGDGSPGRSPSLPLRYNPHVHFYQPHFKLFVLLSEPWDKVWVENPRLFQKKITACPIFHKGIGAGGEKGLKPT